MSTKPTITRAHQLLSIPSRDEPEDPMPGMELTDHHRSELTINERFIPGPANAPDIRVLVYRPKMAEGLKLPVLLHFHGGAFCLLQPDTFSGMEANWSITHQCVVVSIDYRLAPEHPFPAGFEDCYAGLEWVGGQNEALGIDLDRLVVTGASADGALSTAVAQMARDCHGPRIAYQALMLPATDDRLRTPSYRDSADAEGFNQARAEGMWLHYLGEDYDRSNTSPYAAPVRATDFRNLPPAFIQTNGLDPLRDEGIEYGLALMAAGVNVELYNCPGAYHAAESKDPRTAMIAYRVYDAALGAARNPAEPTGAL